MMDDEEKKVDDNVHRAIRDRTRLGVDAVSLLVESVSSRVVRAGSRSFPFLLQGQHFFSDRFNAILHQSQ